MRNNVLTTFPPALSLDFSIVYAKIRFDFDSFRISNENRTRTSYRSLSHHQPTKPPTNQTTNKPTTKPPPSDHNQNRKKNKRIPEKTKSKIENRSRMRKIKLWNQTFGYVWFGTTTSCSGMRPTTAASGCCVCPPTRFGSRTLCSSISE